MKKTVISRKNFEKGTSTTVQENDGGYSIESKGFNLFKDKYADVLQPSPTGTAVTQSLSNDVLAIIRLGRNVGTTAAYMCDRDGYHYKFESGNAIVQVYDDSANAADYSSSFVNMAELGREYFTITKNDILKANEGYTSVAPAWWSTLAGSSLTDNPHDLVIVEGVMYISDGSGIHIWDGVAHQKDALTFSIGTVITAMIKHPNGRDLIVFALRDDDANEAIVYYVDLLTMEFYEEKQVDFRVDVARTINGSIYVAGNLTIGERYWGYFDGTRINKIETENLEDVFFTKANFAKFSDFALLPTNQDSEDVDILAYGKVKGSNIFFKPWRMTMNNGDVEVTAMLEWTPMQLLVIEEDEDHNRKATTYDYSIDTNTGTRRSNFYSNRIQEDKKTWIRRIDVYLEDRMEDRVYLEVWIKDFSQGDGHDFKVGEIDYDVEGNLKYKRIDCNAFTDDYQIIISHDSSSTINTKIKRVEIYSEGEE